MLPYTLAVQVVAHATRSTALAALLSSRLSSRIFNDYAKVAEEMRELAEVQLLALVLDPAVEWKVMAVLDEWERLTGFTPDSTLLEADAITLLEQRRYARAVANAIKHSAHAHHHLVERFPAQRQIFDRVKTDAANPIILDRLRDFIFSAIGKTDFERYFVEAMGYDLPADLEKHAPYCAVGEVIDIPASADAFKEAMQDRKHWEFSKFSVTQTVTADGNRWLVFFV